MDFISLRNHSEYSIIDSILRLSDIVSYAEKYNMPAIGLTDHFNLFAAVKFYKQCIKKKIKPIIGSDIKISNSDAQQLSITLLCKNISGFRELSRIISSVYKNPYKSLEELSAPIELIKQHSSDLFCIVHYSELAPEVMISELQTIFNKDLLLELPVYNFAQELPSLNKWVSKNIPLIATNCAYFVEKEDITYHKIKHCIIAGNTTGNSIHDSIFKPHQRLCDPKKVIEFFKNYNSAISNAASVAKMCNLKLELGNVYLPKYKIPDHYKDELSYIQQSCADKLNELQINSQIYKDRMEFELNVINKMGYIGYFLIVANFINWAKKEDIPVGPGRGSGAGSLVAYLLGITAIDPIQHNLLFERFLNPERVSMPDFDIDFCMDKREKVIEYVIDRYGKDSVSQIITYGSMSAKAVVRDVGRALDYTYTLVDRIAKLIPNDLGITLAQALKNDDALSKQYQEDPVVKRIIDNSLPLEGLVRNVGRHAGGVVISPGRLEDFTPLFCLSKEKNIVSQFDKNDVESIGLVKFDFLGLRTLTIIQCALKHIKRDIDINNIGLDDLLTFKMLQSCNISGVFQLESQGMQELIKRLQPDKFDDLTAAVALYRPGPLQSGMVDDYINRKHGRDKIKYLLPQLEPILEETYGVILYQEQVMQIAQRLAGYSLGKADLLRRAMGKKDPEAMARERTGFVHGCVSNDISEADAITLFDLIEKFAGYGFNKSHSAAYALITYQTAWLKAHYPVEFMAAVLSSDMNNTSRIVSMISSCKEQNIKVMPPDINTCTKKFEPCGKTITYGLGAIKGIGYAAIENIVKQRTDLGLFSSLLGFAESFSDPKIPDVPKKVIESLIYSGSFDQFGQRDYLYANYKTLFKVANKTSNNNSQLSLFDNTLANDSDFADLDYDRWSVNEKYKNEKSVLGFYLSGHPLDHMKDVLERFKCINLDKIERDKKSKVIFIVHSIKAKKNKNGDKFLILTVDDGTCFRDLMVSAKLHKKLNFVIEVDQILYAEVNPKYDEYTDNIKLIAISLITIEDAKYEQANSIAIKVDSSDNWADKIRSSEYIDVKTGLQIVVYYELLGKNYKLLLDHTLKRIRGRAAIDELSDLFGEDNIKLLY